MLTELYYGSNLAIYAEIKLSHFTKLYINYISAKLGWGYEPQHTRDDPRFQNQTTGLEVQSYHQLEDWFQMCDFTFLCLSEDTEETTLSAFIEINELIFVKRVSQQ